MVALIQKSFVVQCVKFWLCEWIVLKQIPDVFENNVHPVMYLSLSSNYSWSSAGPCSGRGAQICLYPSVQTCLQRVGCNHCPFFPLPSEEENIFLLPQVPLRNSVLTFMGLGRFFSLIYGFYFQTVIGAELQYTMTAAYSRVIAVALTPVALCLIATVS